MMQIIGYTQKKLNVIALCDVPAGYVFKFKNIGIPMLRLGSDCGYCELGDAWDSVEELDRERIQDNEELVTVYGKLKSVVVK